MSRLREPADDLDADDGSVDVELLARWAVHFALRLSCDPVPPQPAWLLDRWALSPAALVELVSENDPGAVARARVFLGREGRY